MKAQTTYRPALLTSQFILGHQTQSYTVCNCKLISSLIPGDNDKQAFKLVLQGVEQQHPLLTHAQPHGGNGAQRGTDRTLRTLLD